MSKIQKIAFTFLIGITLGNIGIWSAPALSASELNREIENDPVYIEVMNMSDEEYEAWIDEVNAEYGLTLSDEESGKERAITLAAILATLGKLFGAAMLNWVVRKIADMGLRKACEKFNDSNRAMDYLCDSANQYRG